MADKTSQLRGGKLLWVNIRCLNFFPKTFLLFISWRGLCVCKLSINIFRKILISPIFDKYLLQISSKTNLKIFPDIFDKIRNLKKIFPWEQIISIGVLLETPMDVSLETSRFLLESPKNS